MYGINAKNNSFSYRFLSVAVLIGIFCVQFHSLSHIHLASLSSSKAYQTESSVSSQIVEHSSSDNEILFDCADCVLTKHFQASVEQEASLLLNHASDFITQGNENLLFESSDHSFQLRAPPYTPFN